MTRVLVLGATGMLGHKMAQVLGSRFETWATTRSHHPAVHNGSILPRGRVMEGVDASSAYSLATAIDQVGPDVVVNCIGIVKQAKAGQDWGESTLINGVLPHRMAALGRQQGFRLIHIGTDCVFSGNAGMYREGSLPDATDIYGQSKLTGEVAGTGCLTLRTSIIGRELGNDSHGLVEWFLAQDGPVHGFRKAIFSGLPTVTLADLVGDLIDDFPQVDGLYHVSAHPIDKHRLLTMLRDGWGLDTPIEPVDEPQIDRSLDSTAFRYETGWTPPSWEQLVDRLVQDAKPYPEWRRCQ